MAIICSIEQICHGRGKVQLERQLLNADEWMIAGKVISIKDNQLVFDDQGYKCTLTNFASNGLYKSIICLTHIGRIIQDD